MGKGETNGKGEKRGKGKQPEGVWEGGGEFIPFYEEEFIRLGGRVGWGILEEGGGKW